MAELTPAQLRKFIAELDIRSPIRSVSIDGDTLTLRTAWETVQISHACGEQRRTTCGEQRRTTCGEFTPSVVEGPRRTTTPVPSPAHDDDTLPRSTRPGLDDYTAIDGIGAVTASRLHNAGYYTYDDLRDSLDVLADIKGVHPSTVQRIKAWLDQRLPL